MPDVEDVLPGDSLGIFPTNDEALVDALIQHQQWPSPDSPFEIEYQPQSKKKKSLQFLPDKGISIRKCLLECIDLMKPPSKTFLLAILKFCASEDSANILKTLCAKETMSKYNSEVMEKRITTANLLKGLDIKIPFCTFLEHSTRLLPRPYSIISSSCRSPGRVRLAFSWDADHPGVTTSMLRRIINEGCNTAVYFYVRTKTVFRLEPDDTQKNLIMIGPGLGVIPYLGMVSELEYRAQTEPNSRPTRILFTTWRNEGVDDVFRKEFETSSILDELHFSYTRHGIEPQRKEYVQSLIVNRRKEEIGKLLQIGNTKVFVCGEGKLMIPQIEESVLECLNSTSSSADNRLLLDEMKKTGRIAIEKWF